MDIALLFFLPLIGGFFFLQNSVFTQYRAARRETQRLYYEAALCGIVLTLIGLAAHRTASGFAGYAALADTITRSFLGPLLERPTSGTANAPSPASDAARIALAFACGWALLLALLTLVVNVVVRFADRLWFVEVRGQDEPQLVAAFNRWWMNDQFEILLDDAVRRATLVQCTLSNQKVYVGWVTKAPDPATQEKYFRIQPSMSGFRSKGDGRVTFTTFYDDVLQKFKADPQRLRAYEIVIPMDKIVSASGFDLAAYLEFQKKAPPAPAPGPTAVTGDITVYLGRPIRRS